MSRVFVAGVSGNVGKSIVRAMRNQEGLTLVGGWCREVGEDIGTLAGLEPLGVIASKTLDAGLKDTRPDIVIDFSSANLLHQNFESYFSAGLDAVIGTTGLTEAETDICRSRVLERGLRWSVIANYSESISMVSDFIRRVRSRYPYVSIVDQHTNEMANAPSGTACALAAAAEGENGEVKSREVYQGVLGGKVRGVQVLSQRLPWPGPYSSHEVILGRRDEILKIIVENHSSDIFMEGVFMAVRKLPNMPKGTFITDLSEIIQF